MKRGLATVSLIVEDIVLMMISIYASFMLRFGGEVPALYVEILRNLIVGIIFIKLIILYFFKLYKCLWAYASIDELINIVKGVVFANAAFLVLAFFIGINIPRSVFLLITVFDMAFLGGTRLSYRIYSRYKTYGHTRRKKKKKRIMIIGGGVAGTMTIRELRSRSYELGEPVVIIDDDPMKKGKTVNNIPVAGNRYDIERIAECKEIDEIIIAMPSVSRREIKNIIEECKKTKCKLLILPGVYEIINGKVNISNIREVQIEDLLGREEISLNTEDIKEFIRNKRVMITGGCGSIGFELAKQIAKNKPAKLILVDINENGLYDVQHELDWQYNKEKTTLDFVAKMGSIRDEDRLNYLFKAYRPEIVFHAAAHKHVPMMEDNPHEAIKNNIFGTLNLVRIADKYKVEKFVQISTDKAVNPTNIMGATKRICELIIRTYDAGSDTEFAAVRFGNVLGSNGSVIPLFKKQIEKGGPVTVTHSEIIRYFMTIPEASLLVLQAGAMAKGGEIFILDMGEPVKILTLAEDLIKLSGFIPYEDINIEITGLRPGEKIFEELLLNEEGINQTLHDKIYIGKPCLVEMNYLTHQLDKLKDSIDSQNVESLKKVLQVLVPEYNPESMGVERKVVEFKNGSRDILKKR